MGKANTPMSETWEQPAKKKEKFDERGRKRGAAYEPMMSDHHQTRPHRCFRKGPPGHDDQEIACRDGALPKHRKGLALHRMPTPRRRRRSQRARDARPIASVGAQRQPSKNLILTSHVHRHPERPGLDPLPLVRSNACSYVARRCPTEPQRFAFSFSRPCPPSAPLCMYVCIYACPYDCVRCGLSAAGNHAPERAPRLANDSAHQPSMPRRPLDRPACVISDHEDTSPRASTPTPLPLRW